MQKEEITTTLLKTADKVIEHIDNEEVSREALDDFVKTLLNDDLYLSDFVNNLSARELSAIYISEKLVSDIWSNLATDASFGMEYFKSSQQFKKFRVSLSYYIKFTLEGQDGGAISYLYDAIQSYLGLAVELRKLAEKEIK